MDRFGIPYAGVAADVICGDSGKPEPDLLVARQQRLGVPRPDCLIVGDSVWDVHSGRRAGTLAIGVLTGGSAEQEAYNAGAMRLSRRRRAAGRNR